MTDQAVNVKFGADTSAAEGGIRRVKDALEDLGESIRGPAALLGEFSARLRQGLEVDGITRAIQQFREFGSEIAEIGRTLDTGHALGPTERQGAELQGMFIGAAKPAGADDADMEAREQAEIFAAGERLKLQEAKGSANQIQAVYREWLAEVTRVYGTASKQYFDLERGMVAAAQQATAERLRSVQDEQRNEEEAYRTAAKEAARAWGDAGREIGSQLADITGEALSGTTSIGDAFRQLGADIVKDLLKSSMSSILGGSGGTGGISGLLFGSQGLSGMLGLGNAGLLGLAGNALGLGAAGQAADVAAMWGGGGEADVLAGIGGAGGGSGLFGGLFNSFGSLSDGLLAFQRGGIVPSAAGGWTVPQLGPNGTLARLHSREMVLPPHLSEGLQNMIDGGGAGPAHTFNLNIQAWDGASVMRAGPALVAAINRATRNGSMLAQRG